MPRSVVSRTLNPVAVPLLFDSVIHLREIAGKTPREFEGRSLYVDIKRTRPVSQSISDTDT